VAMEWVVCRVGSIGSIGWLMEIVEWSKLNHSHTQFIGPQNKMCE
jgi:hypothetical protein